MSSTQSQFIEFALASDVLRFGSYKTKAGRMSPYFFNAGLFADGLMLDTLGRFYAQALLAAGAQSIFAVALATVEFDARPQPSAQIHENSEEEN